MVSFFFCLHIEIPTLSESPHFNWITSKSSSESDSSLSNKEEFTDAVDEAVPTKSGIRPNLFLLVSHVGTERDLVSCPN